jgi:hypothetical protein
MLINELSKRLIEIKENENYKLFGSYFPEKHYEELDDSLHNHKEEIIMMMVEDLINWLSILKEDILTILGM